MGGGSGEVKVGVSSRYCHDGKLDGNGSCRGSGAHERQCSW